jgi:hypothetical protein
MAPLDSDVLAMRTEIEVGQRRPVREAVLLHDEPLSDVGCAFVEISR